MNWLMAVLIIATVVVTYFTWIRPGLKERPEFKEFYEQEESFLGALRLKLAGLKQRLTAAVLVIASTVVATYDQLAPMLLEAGVDVQSISDKVPAKAWPFIMISAVGLLQWFRHLSDKRAEANADELESEAEK